MRLLRAVVLPCVLWAHASVAPAQQRAGEPIEVVGGAHPGLGSVAIQPSTGRFLVVWVTAPVATNEYRVAGHRYARDGASLGTEFEIDRGAAERASTYAAMEPDHSFFVVWQREADQTGGDATEIYGRAYDEAGQPRGEAYRLNEATTGEQRSPSITRLDRGGFVVVWDSTPVLQPTLKEIVGRRFDRLGRAIGSEFTLASAFPRGVSSPSVAPGPGGSFLVAWKDTDGAIDLIKARLFGPDGTPAAPEFVLNTTEYTISQSPRAARRGELGYVVVWNNGAGTKSRLLDASGSPVGRNFGGGTAWPSVACDETGALAVLSDFAPNPDDINRDDIHLERRDASGRDRSLVTVVHQPQSLKRIHSVASDDVGNLVVSWTNEYQGGLYVQRYGGLFPAGAEIDVAGSPASDRDGVLEPGEFVDFRPSWRNASGAPQAFAGLLTNTGGPPGTATYVTSAQFDYGLVPDGATASCQDIDCYGVAVSQPSIRPVLHWDATVDESITPDDLGQHKRWRLHVGDSFTDVPRNSPFYRSVETVLHTGVSAGCGGRAFCPQSPTTREQMAALLLAGKEGAGYRAPACGTPVFGDVPASSAFCASIEELARRGITSGCGGVNYCPGDPVSREQMAVFVLRTLDPALDPPACGTPVFADVPASSAYCRWIEELARRGIASGCGGGNFCPGAPVTREQMAVFLTTTFGLQLYGP